MNTFKDFQSAKKYFSQRNTKKKKNPCKMCFQKLDIVINGYQFLIDNMDSYLICFTQKYSKFIDEIVPQHLQAVLFLGKEDKIVNLKKQWFECRKKAKNIVAEKKKNRVYGKKYDKTMKGRCKAIVKLYNRKDEKRMTIKNHKKVYFVDNIPIIIKFSEKKQKAFISKTYGSHSYTESEIELMENNFNLKI